MYKAHRPPTGPRARNAPVNRPPTGYTAPRPGTRGGAGQQMIGGVLNSQVTVPDRPVTRQGLGGMKTGIKGTSRLVQDKSYTLGILRGKIQELNTEIFKLSKELEECQQENDTYTTYEKRAQVLASEVEGLREELSVYNIVIDKLNTDTDVEVVLTEVDNLKRQTAVKEREIDAIFSERQRKEAELKEFEVAVEQERQVTAVIVESMDEDTLMKYQKLMTENDEVKLELEDREKELELLTAKVQHLEEEMSSSEVKQEAYHLYQLLAEAIAKRDEWREKDKESPEQERERLLNQVKTDNQEISSLEKRISELQEMKDSAQDQLRQVAGDLEEIQGEKAAKIRDLKEKEQQRKEFLATFDKQREQEKENIRKLQETNVALLKHISEVVVQSETLPSTGQVLEMEEDLVFKQEEMKLATSTADNLEAQNVKLQSDLLKVEELEGKIIAELKTLQDEIQVMSEELVRYSDLARLQDEEEEKRLALEADKEKYTHKLEAAKYRTKTLQSKYDAEQASLSKNDTYTQLGNLEKKWQYHEMNNFAMKEFIATREVEGNYKQLSEEVRSLQQEYNTALCQVLANPAL